MRGERREVRGERGEGREEGGERRERRGERREQDGGEDVSLPPSSPPSSPPPVLQEERMDDGREGRRGWMRDGRDASRKRGECRG